MVDIAGCAMPLQKIETIEEPASRAMVQGNLFDTLKALRDDFRIPAEEQYRYKLKLQKKGLMHDLLTDEGVDRGYP